MDWVEIGRVTHYYSKIAVAIIALTGNLAVGDKIKIIGPRTETEQLVKSLQVEHQNIDQARPGDLVGLKVFNKIREGDIVFVYSDSK